MKKLIGFATQFYTLWDYEAVPSYTTDSYGNHHQSGIDHKYYYIKNISTDLNKVKALHPGVEINEDLRGTHSFTHNEKVKLPENYFWGGRYSGKLIDEIMESDFQYCVWSGENYLNLYILNHPKYIAHKKAIKDKEQAEIDAAETVKAGDVVELSFTRNGYNADDNYSECWTDAMLGETEVKVLCSGVKPVSGMYPYLMPVIDGKAQKTKGKNIKVRVLEVLHTGNFNGQVVQKIKIA